MTRLGRKLEEATPILTLGAGLIALFLGYSWWWMVFVVGWVVLTPLMGVLFEDPTSKAIEEEVRAEIEQSVRGETRSESSGESGIADREDALDVLRERYARGELDDVEFERKVERLLAIETIEDAEAILAGESDDREPEPAVEE